MILRFSSSAQRAVLVAASFAVAFMLSYFSIRNALAVHYAGLQTAEAYERATHLEPADPRNWYLLGRYWQYNLEDPDAARAIRSYLSALSLNPASSETWLDLATAYESEANPVAARDAFLHANKVYPLSAEAAWRYGNFLLRQGELEPAFTEMRLAVQADPKRAPEAFSRSLRAGSSIETTLDRVLPPISEAYLDVIWDQSTDGYTGNALKVWDRLASLHPRFSLQDSFSLVDALLAERRIAEASRAWDQAVHFAGLADLQSPPGWVLWDGGFESSVKGGGFSWLISEGFREAWIRTRALTTDQGIRFQLHSLGTQDTSTAVTSQVHGTAPWTRIELPWSSGKSVEEMQVCLVRFPSEEAENKIQGTAWVDDVALVPEPAEHAKP